MDGIEEPNLASRVRRLERDNAYLKRQLELSRKQCEQTTEAYNTLLAGVVTTIELDAKGQHGRA